MGDGCVVSGPGPLRILESCCLTTYNTRALSPMQDVRPALIYDISVTPATACYGLNWASAIQLPSTDYALNFTTPNYPQNYDNNLDCQMTIT